VLRSAGIDIDSTAEKLKGGSRQATSQSVIPQGCWSTLANAALASASTDLTESSLASHESSFLSEIEVIGDAAGDVAIGAEGADAGETDGVLVFHAGAACFASHARFASSSDGRGTPLPTPTTGACGDAGGAVAAALPPHVGASSLASHARFAAS